MKYILSEKQWDLIWQNIDPQGCELDQWRIDYWNKNYKPKFNLSYIEYNPDHVKDHETFEKIEELGYWGIIEGDEKNINWFLLNL